MLAAAAVDICGPSWLLGAAGKPKVHAQGDFHLAMEVATIGRSLLPPRQLQHAYLKLEGCAHIVFAAVVRSRGDTVVCMVPAESACWLLLPAGSGADGD